MNHKFSFVSSNLSILDLCLWFAAHLQNFVHGAKSTLDNKWHNLLDPPLVHVNGMRCSKFLREWPEFCNDKQFLRTFLLLFQLDSIVRAK